MRPPCELVQKEYLPAVRSSLSKALSHTGMSQTEIAEQLEITQASVSKYLKQEITSLLPHRVIENVVESLLNLILSESVPSCVLVRELCGTCMSLRVGSHICVMHQEKNSSLKESHCQICSELLGGEETFSQRAKVIYDMQKALRKIETSSTFEKVMPQVRANLVACEDSASSPADVVGVPGRILLVDGKPRVHSGPEFGASGHTARILLWAVGRFRNVRACLCISGEESIVDSARRAGFMVLCLEESFRDVESITSHADDLLGGTGKKRGLRALHVPGGIGIEPILYLFGSSALVLSELCSTISSVL